MARHTAGVNFRFNTNIGFVGAVRATCCVCSFVLTMLLMEVIISVNPKFNLHNSEMTCHRCIYISYFVIFYEVLWIPYLNYNYNLALNNRNKSRAGSTV